VTLSTEVVYQDDAGAVKDSAMWAVQDSTALAVQWRRLTAANPAVPPAPAIDFRRETLLFVAAGAKKAGDRIHVDSVLVQGDALAAFVTITEACPRLAIDVYPLEVVRVSPARRQVRFVVSSAQARCPE
jgi:hypothetical protein